MKPSASAANRFPFASPRCPLSQKRQRVCLCLFSLVVDSQKLTSLLSFSRSSAPFSPGNASTFGSCLLTVAPASSFVVTTLTWATAAPPEALQVCRRCCPRVQHYLPSSFCTSLCADANPANPTALGRQSVPGYETEDQGGHG